MSKTFREQLASAEKQLVALTARIAELKVKAENEFDFSLVVAGTKVEAVFGRAEKKRTVTGVVLGRKSQDKGADMVRIQTEGDAFESEILTVLINNVTAVYDADGNKTGGAVADEGESEDAGLSDPSA